MRWFRGGGETTSLSVVPSSGFVDYVSRMRDCLWDQSIIRTSNPMVNPAIAPYSQLKSLTGNHTIAMLITA